MRKYCLIGPLLFCFAFFSGLYAQPEGGIPLIADPLQNYSATGSVAVSIVDVNDTPFSKAFNATTEDVAMDPWGAQLHFQTIADFSEGDVLYLSFYARTTYSADEAGEAYTAPILEDNVSYEKTLYHLVSSGASWIQYQIPFTSSLSLSASKSHFAFFLGYSNQTVEIADIQLLNYGSDVDIDTFPKTQFSYTGSEDTAAWRSEAAERIEIYRKGNLSISVVDTADLPVDSANIEIRMLQHQFRFGSAIVGSEFLSNRVYREKIYESFNDVVFENDLKWTDWNNRTNHDFILRVLDSLDKHKITARGHVLVWPAWRNLPPYLENLEQDPFKLDIEVIEHIEEVAGFTKGRLIDWDVINEPYDNHDLMDILGKEDMGIWFDKARETDPDPNLFLNDYGILSSAGLNVGHQEHFYQTVQYIERYGGQVDGYGFQGHFGAGLTSITRVFDMLDRYASTGKMIKITEFDVTADEQELQADYLRDFLTITFSHPAVKGFMNWGFWANRHWNPSAAFYDSDWSIRPNGEVWNDLVYSTWWTHDTLMTNASGSSEISGFLGSYEITVTKNGISLIDTLELTSYMGANLNVILTPDGQMSLINEAVPDTITYFEPYNWDVEVPEIIPFVPEEITDNTPEEIYSAESIHIFPNPCTNHLFIRNDTRLNFTGYRIVDLSGRKLVDKEFPENCLIGDLEGLKSGIYSLQLISDKVILSKRIVKVD